MRFAILLAAAAFVLPVQANAVTLYARAEITGTQMRYECLGTPPGGNCVSYIPFNEVHFFTIDVPDGISLDGYHFTVGDPRMSTGAYSGTLTPYGGANLTWSKDQAGTDCYQCSSYFGRAETFTASAVPEPASWAMILVGFGMIGAALRSAAMRPGVAPRRHILPA
jgi:hypothetical protein